MAISCFGRPILTQIAAAVPDRQSQFGSTLSIVLTWSKTIQETPAIADNQRDASASVTRFKKSEASTCRTKPYLVARAKKSMRPR